MKTLGKDYSSILDDIYAFKLVEHMNEWDCLAIAACSVDKREAMGKMDFFEKVIEMVKGFPANCDEKDYYEMSVLGDAQIDMYGFDHVEKFLNYQTQLVEPPSNDIGAICKNIIQGNGISASSLAITILHNLIWTKFEYSPFFVSQNIDGFEPHFIFSDWDESLPLNNADKLGKPLPLGPYKVILYSYGMLSFISTVEAISLLALKIARGPSTKRLQWEFLCAFSKEVNKTYQLHALSNVYPFYEME